MRAATLLGVATGVVTGIVGLVLVMMPTANYCGSMAMMFDDLTENTGDSYVLDGRPPNLDCSGGWSDVFDRVVLELTPMWLVFALSGALGTRIANTGSPRTGAITGALISGLLFVIPAILSFYGPFNLPNTLRRVLSVFLLIFMGTLAGWAGGLLAIRKDDN